MRGLRGGLVAACVTMVGLVAVPGAGATNYVQKGFIGTGAGFPMGVAVDPSNGNIYLAEFANASFGKGTIARFSSAGAPLSPATMGEGYFRSVAVSPAASHDVYGVFAQELANSPEELGGFDQSGNQLGAPFPIKLAERDGNPSKMTQSAATSTGILHIDFIENAVKEFNASSGAVSQTIRCSSCPDEAFLANPKGVAVDFSGNIYVANQGGAVSEIQRVDVDAEGGTFTLTFEGETTADISYGASRETVLSALEALPAIGSGNLGLFREGTDPYTYRVVFEGALAGTDVPQLTADGSGLTGTGVNATTDTTAPGGNFEGRIVKFGPAGDAGPTPTVFAEGPFAGIAVNPANGNVFASLDEGAGWHVLEFDPSGNEISDFGLGNIENGLGAFGAFPQLAVNGTTGVVYVSDINEEVSNGYALEFVPVELPTATTKPATELASTTATLNGEVDPNGVNTVECLFQYTTKANFEANGFTGAQAAACSPTPGNETDPLAVSAKVKGLTAKTDYVYRVVQETESGKAEGDPVEFSTTAAAPKATTEAASGVSQTNATLNAKVDAEGADAACEFEYGTSASYGSKAACSTNPVTGTALTAVSAAISGLAPNTTYHYRVVATNGGGEAKGNDLTFTTSADTCETNAALCPVPPKPPVVLPPPPPDNKAALLKACLAKAKAAFKKAQKAAKRKKGKAKARAMKAANKAKAKAIKRCNSQFA